LGFNAGTVTPSYNNSRASGFAVRCVVDDGSVVTPPPAEPEPVAQVITLIDPEGISVVSATNGVGGATITSALPGTMVGLTATVGVNYTFTNWTVTNTTTSEPVAVTSATSPSGASFTMPDAPVTVTPAATANLYKITATAGTGGSAPTVYPSTATSTGVSNSTEVTLTPNPSEGYVFSNWTVTGTQPTGFVADENPLRINLTSDVTIKANYTEKLYKITVLSDANGLAPTVSPVAATTTGVPATRKVTITVNPNSGYKFSSWEISSGSTPTGYSSTSNALGVNLTGDVTISVKHVAGEQLYSYNIDGWGGFGTAKAGARIEQFFGSEDAYPNTMSASWAGGPLNFGFEEATDSYGQPATVVYLIMPKGDVTGALIF
jgi:hypothetical protein